MDAIVGGPAVDEEAGGAEDGPDEHGWDAPFWEAFCYVVVDFETGVELEYQRPNNDKETAHLLTLSISG